MNQNESFIHTNDLSLHLIMMRIVNKLYGRLHGLPCYGEKTGLQKRALCFVFFLWAFYVSVPFIFLLLIFFCFRASLILLSLCPLSPSFLSLPLSTRLPQSSSELRRWWRRGGAPDTVNSPFPCTPGSLQTFLLIFTGLKASPFSLIIP